MPLLDLVIYLYDSYNDYVFSYDSVRRRLAHRN